MLKQRNQTGPLGVANAALSVDLHFAVELLQLLLDLLLLLGELLVLLRDVQVRFLGLLDLCAPLLDLFVGLLADLVQIFLLVSNQKKIGALAFVAFTSGARTLTALVSVSS